MGPGVLRSPPSTMEGGRHFCLQRDDLRHIILRIITKYIAYYHIAELSARALMVNTHIMWGLKDV